MYDVFSLYLSALCFVTNTCKVSLSKKPISELYRCFYRKTIGAMLLTSALKRGIHPQNRNSILTVFTGYGLLASWDTPGSDLVASHTLTIENIKKLAELKNSLRTKDMKFIYQLQLFPIAGFQSCDTLALGGQLQKEAQYNRVNCSLYVQTLCLVANMLCSSEAKSYCKKESLT